MKQQVLKTLANPAQLFHVPYSLAVLNFVVQFLIYMTVFVIMLISINEPANPMYFLISVIFVHLILAHFSRRDPQLGQILSAKVQLIKRKIPNRLAA